MSNELELENQSVNIYWKLIYRIANINKRESKKNNTEIMCSNIYLIIVLHFNYVSLLWLEIWDCIKKFVVGEAKEWCNKIVSWFDIDCSLARIFKWQSITRIQWIFSTSPESKSVFMNTDLNSPVRSFEQRRMNYLCISRLNYSFIIGKLRITITFGTIPTEIEQQIQDISSEVIDIWTLLFIATKLMGQQQTSRYDCVTRKVRFRHFYLFFLTKTHIELEVNGRKYCGSLNMSICACGSSWLRPVIEKIQILNHIFHCAYLLGEISKSFLNIR